MTYAFGCLEAIDEKTEQVAHVPSEEDSSWRLLYKSGIVLNEDGEDFVYVSARRADPDAADKTTSVLQVGVHQFPRILDAKTGCVIRTSSVTPLRQSLTCEGVVNCRDVMSAVVTGVSDGEGVEDTASAYTTDELPFVECSELINVVATVRER